MRRFLALWFIAIAAPLLYGGVVNLPKVWVAHETLTSADLNNNFSAVIQQINGNLDDVNIKAAAAIKGSKIASAPNGISSAQLNDGSVSGGAGGIITDGTITTADLSASAGILGSQLSTTAGITGGQILDGSLTGSDIAGAAEHHTTCAAGWNTTTGNVTSATGFVIGDTVRFLNPDGNTGSAVLQNLAGSTFTLATPLAFSPSLNAIVTRDDGVATTGLRLGASVYTDSVQRDESATLVNTTDPTGTLNCGTLAASRGKIDLHAEVNGDVGFTNTAGLATTITASILVDGVTTATATTQAANGAAISYNSICTGAGTPISCCSGSGTGTCGNIPVPASIQMPFHLGIDWTQPVSGLTHTVKLQLTATLPAGVVVNRRAVYLHCRQMA